MKRKMSKWTECLGLIMVITTTTITTTTITTTILYLYLIILLPEVHHFSNTNKLLYAFKKCTRTILPSPFFISSP